MTLELSEADKSVLDQLRQQLGASSAAETIRRALRGEHKRQTERKPRSEK
jgi:hypothetical protein